jgi:hypothetical protein
LIGDGYPALQKPNRRDRPSIRSCHDPCPRRCLLSILHCLLQTPMITERAANKITCRSMQPVLPCRIHHRFVWHLRDACDIVYNPWKSLKPSQNASTSLSDKPRFDEFGFAKCFALFRCPDQQSLVLDSQVLVVWRNRNPGMSINWSIGFRADGPSLPRK